MNDNAALNLIRNTFENSFDRERFLIFSKNLFRRFEPKTFVYRGKYIPDAYSTHVKTLERIGKFEDEDNNKIDILAVQLNKSSSLARARTMQRNFIAWYLNGSRGGVTKDAALVAFYTKDSNDWRLSLVKMDYHLGESKAGKIKAITELTPARRFSFLVGANENTHTAQRQLLPILKDTEFKPALSDLESAFSVEVVTKDFFEKYKKLFLDTKEALDAMVAKDAKIKADFQDKNIEAADFAKKLLGQIVFLYFLQKKGWFGVARDAVWGTGPKDFLRRLFEKAIAPYDNFFNDTLEPLFYEALAVERTDNFYSKFNCKIPFLNGGLFDPLGNYDWIHTDIRLGDSLFSNEKKTKEGDIGDGILDVFDRYNFTVKEDEPLEREVAVDPEMLGKVFENLLEVKDRKSKGTYYTPREIVHYMCQESLINYLLTELNSSSDGGRMDSSEVEFVSRDDIETLIRLGETAIENEARVINEGRETKDYHFKLPQSIRNNASLIDESLEKIKVCDPAVGSGAFLVGMMTEVIRVRNILTNYLPAPRASRQAGLPKNDRSIYAFKRHAIQNCLYGVDIDPGAVEIAKLRLWLSLIVDEEDIKQIKPLPNLDYKIMQGNSLLEEYEGVKLFPDESQMEQTNFMEIVSESERIKKEIKELKDKFFKTAQKSAKDKLKAEIERLTWGLIEASVKEQNKLSLLPEIERFKKANIKPFFLWKLNFSEVFEKNGGFDVVMANPPYVGHKGGQKRFFQTMKKTSLGRRFNNERMDLFYYFFHLSLDIVKGEGEIAFITTNYYVTADSAIKLRNDFRKRASIRQLENFNELKIFDAAQGQHNMLTFLNKKHSDDFICDISLTNRTGLATSVILKAILNREDENSIYYSLPQNKLYDGEMNYIHLLNVEDSSRDLINGILNKLVENGTLLGQICNLSQGIVAGVDKISTKHIKKFPDLQESEGAGVFVVNNEEKELIGESPLFKPWFKNSDIYKYKVVENNRTWVIHINADVNLDHYPNIKNHLLNYKKVILSRNYDSGELSRAKKLNAWWALSSSRKEFDFSQPKIISPQRSYQNTFAYTTRMWCSSADVYFITSNDNNYSLKYLIALLNSKLYFLWFYHKGKRKGEMLELYLTPLSEVPIRKLSPEKQGAFINLVDKILATTKSDDYLDNPNRQAQVREYEKQIDQLVYKLYELSDEEIKVIEGTKN